MEETLRNASIQPSDTILCRREQKMRERRAEIRFTTDGPASIVLIKGGAVLRGCIVDLSLSGCQICCQERFSLGIYTRVQIEFYLEGMSFLMAGVVQAIHSSQNVGIRFLDVSPRKRDQIHHLIHEIEETSQGPTECSADGAEGQS